jgi:hypothetical protein
MKRIIYLLLSLFLLFAAGCKEEDRLDNINDSAPAPTPVTINGVANKPGGAVIKYVVPNDKNLRGVKAVYTRNGEICETKASLYTDSLTVEGFGDTQQREITLYAVGWNNKLSTPVTTQITPLTPPVFNVKTNIDEGFGGVIVTLSENQTQANFALVLLADTTGNGKWVPLQTFYTGSTAIKFSCRGLEAKQQTFALYVRDRWNNKSDTLVKVLTPYEEVEIPKNKFSNAKLPTDSYASAENNNNYAFEQLWDDRIVSAGSGFYASPTTAPMPQHFTINLGRKVAISRFKMWPRSSEIYNGSAPRTWELWGSDNPASDGSWDSWFLLGIYSQFKPSGYGDGSAVGTITSEDTEYFRNGGDYELVPNEDVPDPYRTVSYIRFKTTSTFSTYGTESTTGQLIIGELTFWGQLRDE